MTLLRSIFLSAMFCFGAAWASDIDDQLARLPVLNWEQRSDWANVRDTGAIGDGIANDTIAIQKAFDSIAPGTTVYFPAGTYRITASLWLKGALLGVTLIGHGRDTILTWDGPAGGNMIVEDGYAYCNYIGLVFMGNSSASVGLLHQDNSRFTTEVRHQHLGFFDFAVAGIQADRNDKYALAETTFENCIFSNCRHGVSFTQFNDYDFTFDGCEFLDCRYGIYCITGNFYARNCHFERSTEADILAKPEHGISVRRCTSINSKIFITFSNGVSPITIQDCHVDSWTGTQGAIRLRGAPVILFDCTFTNPPDNRPPVDINPRQSLTISQNTPLEAGKLLRPKEMARLYIIPPGKRQGVISSARQTFLTRDVVISGKVFDAVRDFGAKGDRKTDDTAAIQATIDAARAHGKGAIAYLPTGNYIITKTLQMTGSDYYVGGSGFMTSMLWRGDDGGTILEIRDPDRLTLEHINIGGHDAGKMKNAIDINQLGSASPAQMTYNGVGTYGKYQKDPFNKGFHFTDLTPNDTVRIQAAQGNLTFKDCADATILANVSYEGSIIVEGKSTARGGFLGFQSRLATLVTYGLLLKDNHSIVMSDFYTEQADNGYSFQGSSDLPPGRATIQGAKIQFTYDEKRQTGTALDMQNYGGQIFVGHNQFYINPKEMRMNHSGDQPLELILVANSFYDTRPDIHKEPSAHVYSVGNNAVGMKSVTYTGEDALPPTGLAALIPMFDDLRQLGDLDLRINHPRAK